MNFRAVGVLAIVTVALMGCGPEAQLSSSPGGTADPASSGAAVPTTSTANSNAEVVVMVSQFGNGLFDPGSMSGQAGYGQALHATLLEADAGANLIPGIAKSWEVSSDGLTWTFVIRDDVVFHNGEPLTVDDVVFSLSDTFGQEIIDSTTIGAIAAVGRATESIVAVGPNTVEVRHKVPQPFFASTVSPLDPNYPGAIFPKKYFEEVGRDGYNRAPIGAGPFRLVESRAGESMKFERFDDYYYTERIPQFKTLNLQLVPELATRIQALQAGQADIIEADLTTTDQIVAGGSEVVFVPEAAYVRFIFAGCWKQEFACSDPRVRLALDLAIDKEAVMVPLYGEAWANAGWGLVSPSSHGYSPELKPRPLDLEQARRLLAEAGYPSGENFPPIIIYTASESLVPRLPDLALLIKQQWEENLGISVEVRISESDSLRVRWQGRELDGNIFMIPNNGRWDGASSILSAYGTPDGRTRLHEDPQLAAQVVAAQTVTDPDRRREAYNQLYQVLREANWEAGLGSLSKVWGTSPRVTGWMPWSLSERPTALWTLRVNE